MNAAGIAGKVVLVTGVTAGIGRTVAEVFAERGARVVGCGRRTQKGEAVARRVKDAGGDMTFVTADVTVRDDCRAFVQHAVDTHGAVDVLVNNAGKGGDLVPTASVTEAEFDGLMRLHVQGPLFCAQAAIAAMKSAGKGGTILNMASVQGQVAVAGLAGYCSGKAALIQLTRVLAVEHLADDIRANVIVMGGAPTATSAKVARQISQLVHGDVPYEPATYLPPPLRGTSLRDVATSLCALASDDMRAVTGAVIALDQGLSAGALYSEAVIHALSGGWSPPSPHTRLRTPTI